MSGRRKTELGRQRVELHRAEKRAQLLQNAVRMSMSDDDDSIGSIGLQTLNERPVNMKYEQKGSYSGDCDDNGDVVELRSNSTDTSRDDLSSFQDMSNENAQKLNDQQPRMNLELFDAEDNAQSYSSNEDSDSSIFDVFHDCSDDSFDEESDIRPASVTEEDVEDLEDFLDEYNEEEELRKWALSGNPTIPHKRLDPLLAILRKRLLPGLPKSSKTFLKTSKASYNIKVNELDGSEFVYFGILEQLERTVNPTLHDDHIIHLLVNVDGLQLYKSSYKQFWPILCQVFSEENIYKPFPVAIFSGKSKPSDLNQYLEKFVNEINEIQAQGLMIDGQRFTVCIKSFICDRPARAFLKSIKSHGAYWACERCEVHGERYKRRTIYPVDNVTRERTDHSFRQQLNAEHHTGQCPLLNIQPPINMITTFVLDFMHLVCLGIMKKLLGLWLHSKLKIRLDYTGKMILATFLLQLQNQIPCEFQRTTRSLTEIERFKAVEFKFSLLYAGPIIFKKVLPTNLYKHFLLLHIACRILCSKTEAVLHCALAKNLLKRFASLMPRLYGKETLIGNVHSLIHLADDVFHMGCSIFNFTAFPFENALGRIKRLLRNGNKPLAQICRRLHETFFINCRRVEPEPTLKILRQLRPDQTGKIAIKRVKYRCATITTKVPDNTVLLNNGILLQIDDMYLLPGRNDVIQICGTVLKTKGPLLSYPCDSSSLHMWVVSKENQRSGPYSLNQVVQKMVTLEISYQEKRKIYTMPLLHM